MHEDHSDQHADLPPWLRDGESAAPIGPETAVAPSPRRTINLGEDFVASLLHDLTTPQRTAVLHTDGPVLVLAAAGSGKTRVITRRIAYLISCGVPPWSVLALTFTNKAAAEMRERVLTILNPTHDPENRATRGLTVTTFHSLCARLLRRYAAQAGLKEDYTISDSGDQAALVKKVIEALQLSTSNFQPRSVLGAISNAKNQLLDAKQYTARATDFSSKTIAKIYLAYEKALRAANAVDFDDLLLLTAKMLSEHAQVREELQARYQYLLVDEYQDTNRAQFTIARALCGTGTKPSPNVCVVGDPDQSIYAWRGADISNILDFEETYPGCTTITLGENFRSTAPILKSADTLIRKNKRRKHKELFTSRPGGDKVEAILCRDERHEAAVVLDWFRTLQENKQAAWKDMAIFYRTNALSRVLEEAFRAAAIPYTIARGTAFYEREEVKTAVAYLKLLANHADGVSLERVVNTPARGISDASVDKIGVFARDRGTTMFEAMREIGESAGLTARAVASVRKFVGLFDQWSGHGSFMGSGVHGTLADLIDRVLRESGLQQMYRDQAKSSQSETDEQRVDNLDELVSSARQFELEYDPANDPAVDDPSRFARAPDGQNAASPDPQLDQVLARVHLLPLLRGYLESITLVADADSVDPANGSVTLMTFHAAKGLEFHAVAMVGMEEGLLPHTRAVTSPTENEMEEERRLCFVGITRAMRRLLMTSAKYRTMRGIPERTMPSRFLAELDATQLVVSDQSDTGAWDEGGGDEAFESGHRDASFVRGNTLDGARPPVFSSPPPAPRGIAAQFPVGSRVRHPQFGVGLVKSITSGANARAVIAFTEVGTKTLVLEYARLTRV